MSAGVVPSPLGPLWVDWAPLRWQNLAFADRKVRTALHLRAACQRRFFSTRMSKPSPAVRSEYRAWRSISTRWMDNDAYGHVNNVVYYSWFDTAVNAYLIEHGALDVAHGASIGLVVETHCNYFAPLSFPQTVDVGLRVAHRGTSSVRYELGIFGSGDTAAAQGHFVHVYVDAHTRKPAPLSPTLVSVLDALL